MRLTSEQFEQEPIDEMIINMYIAKQISKYEELQAKHAG